METRAMSAVTKVVRAACRMWIPLAILSLTVTATTWPRSRVATRRTSAIMDRVVAAQVMDVPSHNGLYRASLDLTGDSVWVLRLRSASGVPVRNARVIMDAWMPEHDSVGQSTLAADYAGGGAYRVRPVALDRQGWWNVRVQISASSRVDSLAFNVTLR